MYRACGPAHPIAPRRETEPTLSFSTRVESQAQFSPPYAKKPLHFYFMTFRAVSRAPATHEEADRNDAKEARYSRLAISRSVSRMLPSMRNFSSTACGCSLCYMFFEPLARLRIFFSSVTAMQTLWGNLGCHV
jgi:hypothetical protein